MFWITGDTVESETLGLRLCILYSILRAISDKLDSYSAERIACMDGNMSTCQWSGELAVAG
jgi:hypothetical protein